jgi:hypothetical protein
MKALEPFQTTMTLCFTPEHLGMWPHYTAPPKNVNDFAEFVTWAVERYAAPNGKTQNLRAEGMRVGASRNEE